MNQVIIHCKDTYLDQLVSSNLFYVETEDELDVFVDDIDYDPNHVIIDPDEQLCDHYGIDYDQVNCIEMA